MPDILGMVNRGLNTVNTAGQILGIGQRKQDERQIKQQQKLQNQQIEGNKQMLEAQRQKEMQMWKDTNYSAQTEELKKAGLNPALLYGKGGAGGTTVGGTGMGVSGAQAANSAATQTANTQTTGMALQLGMMQAQINLMEAQANKANVEADKTAGVDTQEAQTRIASLTQGIENAKQQELLTKVQTRLAGIQEIEQTQTLENRIDRIEYETSRAAAELEQALNEAYISSNTRQEKITIFQQEAIAGVLNNILTQTQTDATKSNIQVNKAQIQKMAQDIQIAWAQLGRQDTGLAIQKFKEEVSANNPSILNVMGRQLDDWISSIWQIIGGIRPQYKNIK